jgi:hypothetical protein
MYRALNSNLNPAFAFFVGIGGGVSPLKHDGAPIKTSPHSHPERLF